MAIVFTKKKKKQNTLVFVFLFILLVIIFILWQGFFKKDAAPLFEETFLMPIREIKINFESLEKIKKFEPFKEIEPFKEAVSRENPFLPY